MKPILDAFSKKTVLVIGDLILDRFIWGSVTRVSPEAPVPILDREMETDVLGGAANVAANLQSLGCTVRLVGVVGEDTEGTVLKGLLDDIDVQSLVLSDGRPTTVKTRIIAGKRHLVRVDREVTRPFNGWMAMDAMLDGVDAVMVVDYAKGCVTQEVIDRVGKITTRDCTWLTLNLKPGPLIPRKGCSLLAMNRAEAMRMAELGGIQDNHYMRLFARYTPGLLMVSEGDEGLTLVDGDGEEQISARMQDAIDVSGAGDTLLAAFTLASISGADSRTAARIGNAAASLAVSKPGTATVSLDELYYAFPDH